ncbi:hypothetical protein MRQ36_29750 [Micromonospora sp. R77]|uniref:hypothetical protein n=1 Tax=Micromonospora sp. R77 TaxID=2925836 RepID=UPI001F61167B|nr:hypothetical protein [Micromonospora sp. R77]MCI4066516.1 hypothetical protein [Micromonospora sp. R77]
MAVLLSLVGAGIGSAWLIRPSTYPFGPGDRVTMSVTHDIPSTVAGALLVGAALVGLAVAGTGGRSADRARIAAAGLLAAFFALVMADTSLISLLGYALALGGPVALLTALVVACARGRRAGWVTAAALVPVVGVGVAVGLLDPATLSRFAGNVLGAFADYGTRLAWGLSMAVVATGWGWVTYRLWRRDSPDRRPGWAAPERARRWGRVATVGAALCPLPYATVRLSWLTPWAIGLPVDDPAVRIQGAALGCAALTGAVLTLGLVSRWGEVVPRWVPVFGGRAVPSALAVVPGGLVAAAACVAAPGVLLHTLETEGFGDGVRGVAVALFFFPFPVWGPLLAAAVLAYRLRRAPAPAGPRLGTG